VLIGSVPTDPTVTHSTKKIVITSLLSVTWLAALACGAHVLLKYETTAGSVGPIASKWPLQSVLPRPDDKPALVMFAHPHCPCTSASVGELEEIMAHALGRVNAYVLFVKPAGAAPDWDDTGLRRAAAAIPGVTVITDAAGIEAKRFGAETSGHTLIFGRDGQLLFSGGITASRGHLGSNPGETSVIAAIKAQPVEYRSTPVYGCAFTKRDSISLEESCSN
jgi:hypothetical protein